MAKVLIVEDELSIANGLSQIINSINPNIETVIIDCANKAINYARNNHCSAFLLEIQIKDYSGLELAKEIRKIDNYKLTPIIFITSIPTKKLIAFEEIHCYDYIIKPFQEEKVRKVLETIITYGIMNEKNKRYLKLKRGRYFYLIRQEEIIYIEFRDRKIHIITIDDELNFSAYTLKYLMEKLDNNFVRCHKGYIINIDFVDKIDKTNNDIYLKGIELPIPLGRKYKDSLENKIFKTH